MDDYDEYFTLVFKGDARKLKSNPLKTETPFGVPIAVSLGNALERLEDIESAAEDRRFD